MIKKAQDMIKETKKQVRGGNGMMEIIRIFTTDESFTKHLQTIAKVILNPGSSIGLHPHDTNEEIYYILKGNALFDDNGLEKKLQPGDATIIGSGSKHSIKALGPDPLEFVAIIIE